MYALLLGKKKFWLSPKLNNFTRPSMRTPRPGRNDVYRNVLRNQVKTYIYGLPVRFLGWKTKKKVRLGLSL